MTAALRGALVPAIALAAAASLWSATQPADACGCGVAIEAEVNSESGLVIDRPGSEQIILSLDLQSQSDERAAVVLPVPGVPEVAAIDKGDPLAYLDEATQPPPSVGSSGGGDGETAGAAPPVEVIGREEIGGYDVTRLASNDREALDTWLDDNGYKVPDGAEPIFASYIRQGWKFVAIRLAPGSDGRLKPLRVSFKTDIPVYPMRLSQLSTRPIDLTLYTLADAQRQVEGLDTVFNAPVTALDPPPPPELADLFAEGTYVTRLQVTNAAPETFDSDLVIEPLTEADAAAVADDVPAATETPPADESGDSDDGPQGVWQTLGLFAVVIAGWVLVSVLRRRRAARASDEASD
jgi:hypothetical protein